MKPKYFTFTQNEIMNAEAEFVRRMKEIDINSTKEKLRELFYGRTRNHIKQEEYEVIIQQIILLFKKIL
jgi:hypothetical protein